jgi:ABC-type branched-subunit amino acid transport system ATPase component
VIRQLKHEGLSIPLVEQNVCLALQLVDYVDAISKGQIVHSCAPQDLWGNEELKTRCLGI